MAQTIGILGGSFDPVHRGHLALAAAARTALDLDRLIFVPNSRSSLKSSGPFASFEHRVAMLRLALEECVGCEISDVEGRRGGISFTIDTLREFKSENPDASFFLIVGADALEEFYLWRDHQEILKHANLAYVERSNATAVPSKLTARSIPMPRVDVSSTAVRDRLRRGQSIDALVPGAVVKYIASHRLYSI